MFHYNLQDYKRVEAEFKGFEPLGQVWLVLLKIVFNVSRFKPALI